MQQLIEKLYNSSLDVSESEELFKIMLSGEMDPVLISAILIALKVRGESISEIAGLVNTIRGEANVIERPQGLYADCCGTGGDGFNTLNVSTASAFVAAECGLPIIKHGNRSVSSNCGSADIIESLGVALDYKPEQSRQCFDATGFCFLFAPSYHPLMAHVGPVRQKLATRTIFNLAGPLANPAIPPVQLLGVAQKELCKPMAEVLNELGTERALVVHGAGLDEVAVHRTTQAVRVNEGHIEELTLSPSLAGVSEHPLESIQLQVEQNPFEVFHEVLAGKGSLAMTEMVAINAGAALWIAGIKESLETATSLAKEAILDGAAYSRLTKVQEFYHGG